MAEQVLTQCTTGGAVRVHVKDGKITKIRPILLDETDPESWVINARGRTFTPLRKTTLHPYTAAEKSRIYSENRIKYPLKRVDFDPAGERNPQNRGKSGYERISWDEALDLVAGEMKRIRETHGPAAITASVSSHQNWGLLFYKMGPFGRFFNMLGYTTLHDNPDSWEGWHWGAMHTWGYYWRLGITDNFDILEDALQHTDQVIMWSVDPNSSSGYPAQESYIWRLWLKELGIKMIFIDPWCNATTATMGDKWFAPRPGTDAALAEAIAYVWITEDTYDKWFVENRTLGFEEFKRHILGETDGVPRTPQWASEVTGIPAREITALAREWAAKRTMLGCGAMLGLGGACRGAYATEWARLMASGKTEVLHPEYGLEGNVRYIGLPKRFVAGTVVFADTDECAGGVTVALMAPDGTELSKAITNNFGDFEFEYLKADTDYQLKFEAKGYQSLEVTANTADDVYLGEVFLEKVEGEK